MSARKKAAPAKVGHLVTGETIEDVLEELEIAQWDFGHRIGCSQATVNRWITGKAKIHELVRHILSCSSCYDHFILKRRLRGPEL